MKIDEFIKVIKQQGFNTGANRSIKDVRDIKDKSAAQAYPYPAFHETDIDGLNIKGTDERYQKLLGVCVACSVTTYVEWLYWKKTGVYTKLSVAFLYLVIKNFIDKDKVEGTSARSAIRAAMKYGICTEATFPTDYSMDHASFIAQAIPAAAWNEAINYTIGGYISVPVERSIMAAHLHKYGMLVSRYECGYTWWVPSWLPKDIFPLKKPLIVASGHLITHFSYNLNEKARFDFLNWWSKGWGNLGTGYSEVEDYAPTECWVLTLDSVMALKEDASPAILETIWRKLLSVFRKADVIK